MPLTATAPTAPTGTNPADADEATATALLNCLVREVSGPAGRATADGDRLTVRLGRTTLTARLPRPSHGPSPRLAGPFLRDGEEIGWYEVAELVAAELREWTGVANPEFLGQVVSSHQAMTAILRARETAPASPLLASEQSLIAGHRFHPSPKARQGTPATWLRYAPETGARFRLGLLAADPGLLCGEGDFGPLAAEGLLPVHPWQWRLLSGNPVLRRALATGLVREAGPGPEAAPTSSVRTLLTGPGGAQVFAKFSLDVRITNCVRKNAWYELASAPALTRLLKPLLGADLLGEPAYRTVALADRNLYEGLGVILREAAPSDAVVAAALADPWAGFLPEGVDPLEYWEAYARAVALPALRLFFDHGVVLEPHLQNVLILHDASGIPSRAVFRDLEGTKLLPGPALRELEPAVRESVTYDEERGWKRVAYCLFVNHLAEIAAALADRDPSCERELWDRLRTILGELPAHRRLTELLKGSPLPGKANLLTRWTRSPDRAARYVPVPNPMGA
ncbi:IucA/IucC family protein [Actinocorallia sp. A-T 12471]|uniref:IucA/IucC family protein n=1 Tax=Actinocorallia sp. A-T 12471 TaxID=3089813 RepID=UPI0029CE1322|nr:IucA/IucC family protein [Actinocorallia sp. A-T 12471]MDX6738831.1 IucA/IucC family protein [Actinocorallia sp. A-T 12471]